MEENTSENKVMTFEKIMFEHLARISKLSGEIIGTTIINGQLIKNKLVDKLDTYSFMIRNLQNLIPDGLKDNTYNLEISQIKLNDVKNMQEILYYWDRHLHACVNLLQRCGFIKYSAEVRATYIEDN